MPFNCSLTIGFTASGIFGRPLATDTQKEITMTSSRSIRIAMSAPLKIACMILLLSAAVMAQTPYRFSIVAETGKTVPGTSDLLTSIDRNVSINSNGFVAFVGTRSGPNVDGVNITGENLYAYDSSAGILRRLMNNAFVLPLSANLSSQIFSPGIQINDQNVVIARRRMNATVQIGFPFGQILSAPFTYIEKWHATQPANCPGLGLTTGCPIQQVAMGDAGVGAAAPLLFFLNPATGGVYPSPFVPFTPFSAVYLYPSLNNNGQVAMAAKGTFPSGGLNYLVTPASPPHNYNRFQTAGVTQGSATRPVIADDGSVVARITDGSSDEIRLFNNDLTSSQLIAGPSNGFTSVGQSPGVSDNGEILAFNGNLTDPDIAASINTNIGQGVFVSIDEGNGSRKLLRIAATLGELGVDTRGNPTTLLFSTLNETDSRAAVVHVKPGAAGNERSVIFASFIAAPSAPSPDNSFTSQLGLRTVQVNMERQPNGSFTYQVFEPKLVAQIGGIATANNTDYRINNLAVYDQLAVTRNGKHRVAFWASTDHGEVVFKAAPVELPLIFIPGAGASYLERSVGGVKQNLWPAPGGFQFLDPTDELNAPDVFRYAQVGSVRLTDLSYGRLLDMLKDPARGGYREYDLKGEPNRCDLSQRSDDPDMNPNLFVFPYDWTKTNAINASKLKSYVNCVQGFHPNSKVNILTHSMGSLLARRYILDNRDVDANGQPQHKVNKLTTIGAPWLGAPKAIAVIENGDFFLSGLDTFPFFRSTIKRVAVGSKGLHELLPSRTYAQLIGSADDIPFCEDNVDFNGDGIKPQFYSYDMLVDLLDKQFPSTRPGTANIVFHDIYSFLQDDWSEDQTNVQYYHIYGIQASAKSIRQVKVRTVEKCISFFCSPKTEFPLAYTSGDGTVPRLSAERKSAGKDLNAPGATLIPFFYPCTGDCADEDTALEHSQLPGNPDVHKAILAALNAESGQLKSSSKAEPALARVEDENGVISLPQLTPANYLYISGYTGSVVVTDELGRSNTPIDGTIFLESVPGVTRHAVGENAEAIITSMGRTYTVRFGSGTEPLNIELTQGTDTTTTLAIRYRDLVLPNGAQAMIKITPQGAENLLYDSDGDGTFETSVPPTVSVSGSAAQDVEGPVVTINEVGQQTTKQITIVAQDSGSGVKAIYYSLDGTHFRPYAGSLNLDPSQTPVVYAFADDNVANRSGLTTLRLTPLVNCASDVTTSVIITRSGFYSLRGSRLIEQVLTIKNTSSIPITAPISLVLDNLSSSFPLFDELVTGHTACAAPLNSPFVNVDVGSDGVLSPGESATVTLQFIRSPGTPRGTSYPINYATRVLAGAGER